MSRSGRDWLMPWVWFCFLFWAMLTMVVYLRILQPAEWFQNAGMTKLAIVLLNLWVTEFLVGIPFILVAIHLLSKDDGSDEEEQESEEVYAAPGCS